MGEVLRPPGERSSEEEREREEDGTSDELRIVIAGMEVRGEEMDEG